MNACPQCGIENAPTARICEHCQASLDAGAAQTQRLLAGIQGLIPAEPIISTGRLREDEPEDSAEYGAEALRQAQKGPPTTSLADEPAARVEKEDRGPAPAVELETPVEEEIEQVEQTPSSEPEQSVQSRHPVWIPAFEDEPEPESDVVEVAEVAAEDERVKSFPIVLARRTATVLPRQDVKPSPLLWIIALVLVSAILLGNFFSPDKSSPAPRRPAVESTYTYIELLPDRSRVLLAWDYEPTTQGEMHLLAQPIVRHLRLKRARIANVSLRPTGPAVAADAIALADSQLPLGAQGAQPPTVELGFIPGDAAALRAISQFPLETANLPELSAQELDMSADETVEAFDLIIEFSAETIASREWIEQVASRQRTPVIIVASGAIAPTLRPYEQTGQIAALLSGYPDALAYEQMLGSDGPASAQQGAQTWLSLLFVALIIVIIIRSVRKPQD